jgi:hypothetical protein
MVLRDHPWLSLLFVYLWVAGGHANADAIQAHTTRKLTRWDKLLVLTTWPVWYAVAAIQQGIQHLKTPEA